MSTFSSLHQESIAINHYQLDYLTGGVGEPVVLLHGLGGGSYVWQNTAPTLARYRRIYVLDFPGLCYRSMRVKQYSCETLAQILADFFQALHLQRASLIAHSMGGVVALTMLGFSPTLVDKLVLVASGGLGRSAHLLVQLCTLPGLLDIVGVFARPQSRLRRFGDGIEHRLRQRLGAFEAQHFPTLLDQLGSPASRNNYKRMIHMLVNPLGQKIDCFPLLEKLQDLAILIIWGARDTILPIVHGRRAAQRLPNSHFVVMPETSHEPQLEQPLLFNEIVLDFLLNKE
jgi:pimeloyl-ACP methyl ester carboxylesterase